MVKGAAGRPGKNEAKTNHSFSKRIKLQRLHIDDEPIPHISLYHTLISLVDVLDVDDLDIGDDMVLGAKVQHLLCFGNTSDTGTCEAFSTGDDIECMYRWNNRRRSTYRPLIRSIKNLPNSNNGPGLLRRV